MRGGLGSGRHGCMVGKVGGDSGAHLSRYDVHDEVYVVSEHAVAIYKVKATSV